MKLSPAHSTFSVFSSVCLNQSTASDFTFRRQQDYRQKQLSWRRAQRLIKKSHTEQKKGECTLNDGNNASCNCKVLPFLVIRLRNIHHMTNF